jgi:hypothetical protein
MILWAHKAFHASIVSSFAIWDSSGILDVMRIGKLIGAIAHVNKFVLTAGGGTDNLAASRKSVPCQGGHPQSCVFGQQSCNRCEAWQPGQSMTCKYKLIVDWTACLSR